MGGKQSRSKSAPKTINVPQNGTDNKSITPVQNLTGPTNPPQPNLKLSQSPNQKQNFPQSLQKSNSRPLQASKLQSRLQSQSNSQLQTSQSQPRSPQPKLQYKPRSQSPSPKLPKSNYNQLPDIQSKKTQTAVSIAKTTSLTHVKSESAVIVDKSNLLYTEFKKLRDSIEKHKKSKQLPTTLTSDSTRRKNILAKVNQSQNELSLDYSTGDSSKFHSKVQQQVAKKITAVTERVSEKPNPASKTDLRASSPSSSRNKTPEKSTLALKSLNALPQEDNTRNDTPDKTPLKDILTVSKSLTNLKDAKASSQAPQKQTSRVVKVISPEKMPELSTAVTKVTKLPSIPKFSKDIKPKRTVSLSKVNNSPRIEQNKTRDPQLNSSTVNLTGNKSQVYHHDLEFERNRLLLQAAELIDIVRTVPVGMQDEPKKLVKYLSKYAETDLEKVWIIFLWITHNIKYETGIIAKDKIAKNQDPLVVMTRKLAVSTGYCYLFKELVKCFGFVCNILPGHARIFTLPSAKKEKESSLSEHEWVTIQIQGRWYLIDPTWAAGYVDAKKGNFVFDFEPFWFMTQPAEFIYRHLPKDPKWQLIEEKPIDDKTFVSLLFVEPVFFDYKINIFSDDENKNTTTNPKELFKMKSKDGSGVLAVESGLLQTKIRYESEIDIKVYVVPSDGDPRYEAFVQREKNYCTLTVPFKKSGIYMLEVLARRFCEENAFKQAIKFGVNVIKPAATESSQMPTKLHEFDINRCYLQQPLFVSFTKGDRVTFKLKVSNPAVTVVAIRSKFDEDWRKLDKSETEKGVWAKEVLVEGMPLQVGVKTSTSKKFKPVLEYGSS